MRAARAIGLMATGSIVLLTAACGSTVHIGSSDSSSPVTGAALDGGGVTGPGATSPGGAGSRNTPAFGDGSRPETSPGQPDRDSTGLDTGASSPPVAAGSNTAPLKVGITYVDNSGSSAALGGPTTKYSFKAATDALLKALNAAGGLHGRRIVPVTYVFDSQSSDYSTPAAAACAKFTQDDRVDIVLDSSFGYTSGFAECLDKAKVLHLTTLSEADNRASQADTLHFNTAALTPERAYATALSIVAASGYLTKSSKLGVIIEDCPSTQAAYSGTIAPLIKRLGLQPPLTRTFQCTTGFASAAGSASQVSSHSLAFSSGGVDRVMFVSDQETVAWLFFQNQAGSQSYRPGYILTSNAQPESIRTSINPNQRPQIHGAGWMPLNDVQETPGSATPVERRCYALAKSGGGPPSSASDKIFVNLQCGMFLLLEAALQRTQGDSHSRALYEALVSFGRSFSMPGLVGGRTMYAANRHDGPDAVREFSYVTSCSCLRYIGAMQSPTG